MKLSQYSIALAILPQRPLTRISCYDFYLCLRKHSYYLKGTSLQCNWYSEHEWSPRITAVLDIAVEDDRILYTCAFSAEID